MGFQEIDIPATGGLLASGGSGGAAGVNTVGAFSTTPQVNGAGITGTTITFGPADIVNPGMLLATSSQTAGVNLTLPSINATTGFLGRTNGTLPQAGYIGQSLRTATTAFTNTPATTVWGDMGNVPLTAGQWLCSLQAQMSLNGSVMTEFAIGISGSSGINFVDLAEGDNEYESAALPVGAVHQGSSVSQYQLNLAGSSTYYAKVKATFSAGNPQYAYRFQCNRIS